jgi:hypothetical protein
MSDMQNVLKGVVRDHRLPQDYRHHFNQPWGSRAFMKNFKRFMVVRQMTKQNVTTPLFLAFVSEFTQLTILIGFHSQLYLLPCYEQLYDHRSLPFYLPRAKLALQKRYVRNPAHGQPEP